MTTERVGEVIIERLGRVVRATIDRPSVRNAINDGVIDGLSAALDATVADDAHVLVIRGGGGTFCAGADMKHTRTLVESGHDAVEQFVGRIADLCTRIEHLDAATIAVVEGHAVAGGFELMLSCDIAIASTDAYIGDRHMEYAVLPGAGSSARLLSGLPRSRARHLLLTGDLLTGEKAAAWGLVADAVEPAQLDSTVDALVKRISSRSRDGLRAMRRLIQANNDFDPDAAVATERRISREYSATSDDRRAGIEAFNLRRSRQNPD